MKNNDQSSEQVYRTMLVIWAALLMSQLMFFAVVYSIKPELFQIDLRASPLGEFPAMTLIFSLLAISNLGLSLFLSKTFTDRAIEQQSVGLVQTAMIIGCALSESISLIGVFMAISFSYRYFFAFIVLGIVGMVLNFPSRDKIHAASPRRPL